MSDTMSDIRDHEYITPLYVAGETTDVTPEMDYILCYVRLCVDRMDEMPVTGDIRPCDLWWDIPGL